MGALVISPQGDYNGGLLVLTAALLAQPCSCSP